MICKCKTQITILVLIFSSSIGNTPSFSSSPLVSLRKIGVPIYSYNHGVSNSTFYLGYDRSGTILKYFKSLGLLNTQPVFLGDTHSDYSLLVYDDSTRRIYNSNFKLVNNLMRWAYGNGTNIYIGFEVFQKVNLTNNFRQWPPKGDTFWYLNHFGGNNVEIRETKVSTIIYNTTNFKNLFGVTVPSEPKNVILSNARYIQYTTGDDWLIRINGTNRSLLTYKTGVLLDPNRFVLLASIEKFRSNSHSPLFTKDEVIKIWEKMTGDSVDGQFDITLSYAGFKNSQMVLSMDDSPRYTHTALNVIDEKIGGKIASLMCQGNRINLGDLSLYEYKHFTDFELHSLNHTGWGNKTLTSAIWDMNETINVIERHLSYSRPYYIWRTPGTAGQTNENVTLAINKLQKIVGISDHPAQVNVMINNYEAGFPYVSRVLYQGDGSIFYNLPRDQRSDITWLRDTSLTDAQKVNYAYGNYSQQLETVRLVHGVWIFLGHESDLDKYPELIEKLLDYAILNKIQVITLRGAYQTQRTLDQINITFDGFKLIIKNNWNEPSFPITINFHNIKFKKIIYNGKNWILHNGNNIQIPQIPASSQIIMTTSINSVSIMLNSITTGAWIEAVWEDKGNLYYNMSEKLELIGTFTLPQGLRINTHSNVHSLEYINYIRDYRMITLYIKINKTIGGSSLITINPVWKPKYITGAILWEYNATIQTLTIKGLHQNNVVINYYYPRTRITR